MDLQIYCEWQHVPNALTNCPQNGPSADSLRGPERWLPSPFLFALTSDVVLWPASAAPGPVPWRWSGLVRRLLDLLSFGMQMTLILMTGYALAQTKPVDRLLTAAGVPAPERGGPRRPADDAGG